MVEEESFTFIFSVLSCCRVVTHTPSAKSVIIIKLPLPLSGAIVSVGRHNCQHIAIRHPLDHGHKQFTLLVSNGCLSVCLPASLFVCLPPYLQWVCAVMLWEALLRLAVTVANKFSSFSWIEFCQVEFELCLTSYVVIHILFRHVIVPFHIFASVCVIW